MHQPRYWFPDDLRNKFWSSNARQSVNQSHQNQKRCNQHICITNKPAAGGSTVIWFGLPCGRDVYCQEKALHDELVLPLSCLFRRILQSSRVKVNTSESKNAEVRYSAFHVAPRKGLSKAGGTNKTKRKKQPASSNKMLNCWCMQELTLSR